MALFGAAGARASLITYDINVNTSGLSTTMGILDFQFDPGAPPVDAGTAIVAGLSSDGTLLSASVFGDVSGALPGAVDINNTDVANEYSQNFIFGSFFDVFVTLDIPSLSGTAQSGSSFFLTLEDSVGDPLVAQGGPLVEIDLGTDGSPTVQNFSSNGEATVDTVPEPNSLLLLIVGLVVFYAVPCVGSFKYALNARDLSRVWLFKNDIGNQYSPTTIVVSAISKLDLPPYSTEVIIEPKRQ